VIYRITGSAAEILGYVNDHGLRYFGDYAPGAIYECGSVSIDAARIVSFGKGFDPQTFHVDPVVAAGGPFGGLIASGWHTAALTMRLLVDNYLRRRRA
jgi:acyl dehydratase